MNVNFSLSSSSMQLRRILVLQCPLEMFPGTSARVCLGSGLEVIVTCFTKSQLTLSVQLFLSYSFNNFCLLCFWGVDKRSILTLSHLCTPILWCSADHRCCNKGVYLTHFQISLFWSARFRSPEFWDKFTAMSSAVCEFPWAQQISVVTIKDFKPSLFSPVPFSFCITDSCPAGAGHSIWAGFAREEMEILTGPEAIQPLLCWQHEAGVSE